MNGPKEFRATHDPAAVAADESTPEQASPRRRRRLRFALVGIAVVAVLMLPVLFDRPGPWEAAPELKGAADATRAYRGWIHVEIDSAPVIPPHLQAHVRSPTEMHYNTADRRFAGAFTLNGQRGLKMIIPAKSEQWLYSEAAKELAITSSSEQSAIAMMVWGADDPLKLAALLEKWDAERSRGRGIKAWLLGRRQRLEGGGVERTEEGEFIRFDLTPPDKYQTTPPGKTTYWCDRTTKLIRRVDRDVGGGNRVVLAYSYGAPEIRDIYDLGVPRDVRVTDTRNPSFAADPVVGGQPDLSRLTKDDQFDLKGFVDRLQERMEADYGDFVMVECEEPRMPYDRNSQGSLKVEGRQGVMGFLASYTVGADQLLSGGAGFPRGWPTPRLADVMETMTLARPSHLYAYDGATGRWNNQAGPMTVRPIPRDAARSRLSLAPTLWPIQDIDLNSTAQKVEALKDGNRPGLIVLRVQASHPHGFRTGTAAGGQLDATYWFDPKRDDLLVEIYQRAGDAGDNPLPLEYRRVRMKFAQLANGRWYPTQEQFRSRRPPLERAVNEPDYVNVHRQLLERQTLPEDWYSDPSALLRRR